MRWSPSVPRCAASRRAVEIVDQQINLYEQAAHPRAEGFAPATLAAGLLAITAGLTLISLFAWWRTASFDHELRTLRTALARRDALIQRGSAFADAQGGGGALETRLRALAVTLDQRRAALGALAAGAAGSPQGFAPRLAALAAEHVDGLWLRRIVLTGDSRGVVLEGRATEAALVPRYLADLARQPALHGLSFDELRIRDAKLADRAGAPAAARAPERDSPDQGSVRFTVRSGTPSRTANEAARAPHMDEFAANRETPR